MSIHILSLSAGQPIPRYAPLVVPDPVPVCVLLLDTLGVLLMLASGVRVSDAEAGSVALAVREADGEGVAVPLLVPAAQNAKTQKQRRGHHGYATTPE